MIQGIITVFCNNYRLVKKRSIIMEKKSYETVRLYSSQSIVFAVGPTYQVCNAYLPALAGTVQPAVRNPIISLSAPKFCRGHDPYVNRSMIHT